MSLTATMTTITGSFKKPNGTAAANCILRLYLFGAVPEQVLCPQNPVNITLDGSGAIPGGTQVYTGFAWFEDGFYRAQLLDPTGTSQLWADGPWYITGTTWAAPTAINALS